MAREEEIRQEDVQEAEDMNTQPQNSSTVEVNTGEEADFSVEEAPETDEEDDNEILEGENEPATEFSDEELQKMSAENEKEIAEQEAEDAKYNEIFDDGTQVVEATRSGNRKHFTASRVIPIQGNTTEFESATAILQRIKADYALAARSYFNGRGQIKSGKVVAVDTRKLLKTSKDAEPQRIPMLVLTDGPIAIYIPVTDFTRLRIPEEGATRQSLTAIANERIGSEIEYMVKKFDEKNRIALGTRLGVLDSEIQRCYLTPTRNGQYIVEEGRDYEARVIYMSETYLGVELHGIEYSIPAREVSWTRTRNLYDFFRDYYKEQGMSDMEVSNETMVGKTIPVRVMSIDRKSRPVQVVLSAKRAMIDYRPMKWDQLQVRMNIRAKISNVSDKGIFAKLEGWPYDCLCIINQRRMPIPRVGQNVMVQIYGKERLRDEFGDPVYNIRASITRILG